ncbi:GILT-like protein 1 [Leptinotarsa decemlineata]|uniref:GILT-like protein 1 n=1 Tax=Leptinotarsa decemlineata TaxID=7539 RepID=UPI003D30D612
MKLQLILSFVLTIVCVLAQHENHNHEDQRVNVSVYYESLCPDSRKFFTLQLYPSLQGNLSSFVNLTLVPYGKSKATFDINEWRFECHHGEQECQGNKIQACALKHIDNGLNTPGYGFNKISLAFINCLMDKADKNAKVVFPTKECATYNPVNNLGEIENCANHTSASNYLAMFGKLTDQVQNPLKSVPTIVFNNQYKQADSDLAQTNFVKALCQYIKGEKPAECTRNGGESLKICIGFLSILAVLWNIH